jgi:hypothetical protein
VGAAVINVQRSDFISHLWELTKSQSLVLTGSPGVGKTWAIGQLIRRCKQQSRRVLSLSAEDFDVRSVDELQRAIGFKTDLQSLLASFGPEALLIIDGLDALRGEASQRAFRELIETVTLRVPTCSVVVSIRTFDLNQSYELQRMFFNSHTGRRFASVTVPAFSEAELFVAAEQAPGLKAVLVANDGSEIRELLKNPFNLRLALDLLEGGVGIEEFSSIHGQVQLLQRYWSMRVEAPGDGTDRKALLRHIIRQMVERKTLSITEEVAYLSGSTSALKDLRSSEILRESVTDRISFTHNVLFDYAVARLVFDEEEIVGFITSDSSRTIFFRPSIVYFFHHLWWNNRVLFWQVATHFFNAGDIPERVKVVPAIVVTEAARNMADVEPLMAQANNDTAGISLTLRAVQALTALQSQRRRLWLDVLDRLSQRMELGFINEVVMLLGIANRSKSTSDEDLVGSIARRLIKWIWMTAKALPKHQGEQLYNVAAISVLSIVLEYSKIATAETRAIVESLLSRLGTADSSPHDAFRLAHSIENLIDADPQLAASVYQRMFSHPDSSEEKTVMGSGPVFTFTSTRKQDFETALYVLRQSFPKFFKASPEVATTSALIAINNEVLEKELKSESQTTRRQGFSFRFLGRRSVYISDFSEIWDRGASQRLALPMLDVVLDNFIDQSPTVRRNVMRIFAERASVAVCWKRLLEASARRASSFFRYTRTLLKTPRILAAPETAVAAGDALKAAYAENLPTEADSVDIEDAIIRISRSRFIKRYEKADSIQNRLISCIGVENIRSTKLRLRASQLSQSNPEFVNEPYVRFSGGSMPYSAEDWLRDQGANLDDKKNSKMLAALKPITEFERAFLSSIPSEKDSVAIEAQLKTLYSLLATGDSDKSVSQHARGTLNAAAKSIVKNSDLNKDLPLVEFCRRVLIEGIDDPSPEFDPDYHDKFDLPSWGSPIPRIEAAQGLSYMIQNYGPDQELLGAFTKATNDLVPAVRYQAAVGLVGLYKQDVDDFWTIIDSMLRAETTPGVMLGLLQSLGSAASQQPELVVGQLTKTIDRGLPITERAEVTRTLVQILTGLYVVRDNANALNQLTRFENEPVRYAAAVTDEIFTASFYIGPNNGSNEVRQRARETFRRILVNCFENLNLLSQAKRGEIPAESIKALMRHIDEIATRLHFALDFKPNPPTSPGTNQTDIRRDIYFEIKPLIALISEGRGISREYFIPASTAHYLLQTLSSVLSFDPGPIIKFALGVCNASLASGYQFDSYAIAEIVKIVEESLADHRHVLQEPSVASALGQILDIFVKVGWPEALQLTFKLDQAVR